MADPILYNGVSRTRHLGAYVPYNFDVRTNNLTFRYNGRSERFSTHIEGEYESYDIDEMRTQYPQHWLMARGMVRDIKIEHWWGFESKYFWQIAICSICRMMGWYSSILA